MIGVHRWNTIGLRAEGPSGFITNLPSHKSDLERSGLSERRGVTLGRPHVKLCRPTHQLSHRISLHRAHDLGELDLNGDLASSEFVSDFLIHLPRNNKFHYLAFPRGERFVAPSQFV